MLIFKNKTFLNFFPKNKTSLYYFFIIILPIIFFYKLFLYQEVFLGQDVNFQNLPAREYVAFELKKGNFPLWAPEMLSGYPIFAEGQAGVLYPLNIIFLFLPPAYAYNLSFIFHLSLAGLFTFLFVNLLLKNKFCGLISAMSFMFCGFILINVAHINMINTLIWLPLIFYLTELYFQKQKTIFILPLVLSLTISFLAGHFPTLLKIILLFSFYFIFKLSFFLKKSKKFILLTLVYLIVVFFLFFLLSAVQFLPSYELTKLSVRAKGLNYEEASTFSLPINQLITTLFRFSVSDDTIHLSFIKSPLYLGILPLLLSIFSLLRINKQKIFWLVVALVSVLLALGKNAPLWKTVQFLPVFKYLRTPNEFIIWYVFSLSVLAGFGYWLILKYTNNKNFNILILLILLIDIFPYNFHFNKKIIEDPFADKLSGYILTKKVNNVFDVYLKSPTVYNETPEFIKYLKKDKSLFRVFNVLGPLWLSGNLPYKISSIDGSTPLLLNNYEKLLKLATQSENINILLNVKYLIVQYAPLNKNLELAFKDKSVSIYKMKKYLPRVFIARNFKIINDEEELLYALSDKDTNLKEIVFLTESPYDENFSTKKYTNEELKILSYKPNKIKIQTTLKEKAILVLLDNYYPGWIAYVNGKEEKIYKANYSFRAVSLNAGENKIVFIYKPFSFYLGLIISCLTLFILSLILIMFNYKILIF